MIQKNRVHIIVISILNHLPPGLVPSCASGVLGILPGVIGCIQANEVIKVF